MKCTICGKSIVLSPSAAERARRYGGSPSDYSRLFTEHTECLLDKRRREVEALMRRIAQDDDA